MAKNKESTGFILKIAVILSLACATLVSLAAVGLKPIQDKNAAKERKTNILIAAGVFDEGKKVDELFEEYMIPQAIELKTGESTDAIDVNNFNALKAAKDAKLGAKLTDDPAKLGYQEKHQIVYQLKNGDTIKRVVLPIRGYGLWGTMRGFLALSGDGKTIENITFFDHKETPGLGGEIVNPDWQGKWSGKQAYSAEGVPAIALKKTLHPDPEISKHQVDSLAGATLTSRGVQNMINFWLSDQGYGPYLQKLANQ